MVRVHKGLGRKICASFYANFSLSFTFCSWMYTFLSFLSPSFSLSLSLSFLLVFFLSKDHRLENFNICGCAGTWKTEGEEGRER